LGVPVVDSSVVSLVAMAVRAMVCQLEYSVLVRFCYLVAVEQMSDALEDLASV
jgi:hypothetical protein